MLIGTSKVDITPRPGVELCGFANRSQPSDHVLDELYASILLLQPNEKQYFLINLDLIGVKKDFVEHVRKKIRIKFKIPENHIQVFATHTHSGPGTIQLNYCGAYNPEYIEELLIKLVSACEMANKNLVDCKPVFSEKELMLGVNRRVGKNSPLKLKSLAWMTGNGSIKSIMVNYPMHPVYLKGTGLSADYPGVVKKKLEESLKGNPVVLFGLGAAGDFDPPEVGVEYNRMEEAGSLIVRNVIEMADQGLGTHGQVSIRTKELTFQKLGMNEEEIDEYADKYLIERKWHDEFGEVFGLAVNKWRKEMKNKSKSGENGILEISMLEIGVLKLFFVSAELFSEFERILKEGIDGPFMVITCANGLEGYIPAQAEYERGGYELETAIFFYNTFIPKPGTMEIIADKTLVLLNS